MTPRRISFRVLSAVALGLLAAGSLFAQSLRDTLSPQDFERAGLGKLTPEELRALSELVQVKASRDAIAGTAASSASQPATATSSAAPQDEAVASLPRGEAAFGREAKAVEVVRRAQNAPDKMEARIKGPFNGWHGNTEFHLENGQVWRQSEPGEFVINLDSPVITIRKGFLGTYFMTVEGYNSRVKVQRLR